ncbi:MAG: protein-glutamate O-methyltransferase [Polyangiaceae bacterium]
MSLSVSEAPNPAREFELGDKEFQRIQKLLKERSGIDIGAGKRMLAYGRLARRMRALKLTKFSDYLLLVDDPTSEESGKFLNALTTNVTELFREEHHFELLAARVVPEVLSARASKLRIWSAACSAGDEPYSIALTLSRTQALADLDVRILATDIDTEILDQARRGVYAVDRVAKLKPEFRSSFQRGTGANAGNARISPALRELVTFKQLNLLDPWPMSGPFDVIFCRNVFIYFDTQTRERLVRRFASLLRPGGYLFLGHSESPSANSTPSLKNCGRTAFIKHGEADGP